MSLKMTQSRNEAMHDKVVKASKVSIICDRILENRRYTYAQQYFCNKTHLKTTGKKRKLQKRNYENFYCLAGGRIKQPMDKSWASSCSPVYREYKNLCCISIHEKIPKLQTFVYVAVTKEFTHDRLSVNVPSFSNKEACLGEKTIPWWMHRFMANTMSQNSIPYVIVLVSYDGLCKCL